jgi:peptide/nickel transport system ATP-binding protein
MTPEDVQNEIVVRGLVIADAVGRRVVDGVSFDVSSGTALGIVGESGSGKTTIALALLGWVRPGLSLVSGAITISGEELPFHDEAMMRRLRGRLIAYVPQNAALALNPSMRVGRIIREVLRGVPGDEQARRVSRSLELVNLPADRSFQRRYPHQLSGGQQQRLGLAVSLARRPRVLVLDEPTTGLDVITQKYVLDQVDVIRAELGITTVSISHDLRLISARTDSLLVMLEGKVVEAGPSRAVLENPGEPYTKTLVDAIPGRGRSRRAAIAVQEDSSVTDARRPAVAAATSGAGSSAAVVLDVQGLHAGHRAPRRGFVVAAKDVSFSLERGRCLALVGESGSGKTTIARCVVGLHAPQAGRISLEGETVQAMAKNRSTQQRRRLQIIFQDPTDSLNPKHTVYDTVARPLRHLLGLDRTEAKQEVERLLDLVRLPKSLARAYPGQLSGGECQRAAIARALAPRPDILVCDEITSALDTSIQASIIDLIAELRGELGLSLLFISHDLPLVASLADDVMVLERGTVCEHASAEEVLENPKHAYAKELIAASALRVTTQDQQTVAHG